MGLPGWFKWVFGHIVVALSLQVGVNVCLLVEAVLEGVQVSRVSHVVED